MVVVLDNVRSMNNVGSIFRTSDAFLVEAIHLCGYTPCPPHRDIHKTALGATETVPWSYAPDTVELVGQLREEGYLIFAVEQAEGSTSLETFRYNGKGRLVLVFGNEVEGVQDQVLALCDGCLEIPQGGMKHSLNISVAAGMVLWEIYSQWIEQQASN
jgi:tRNA G18 (ribose-2'-O)-methylase SpoU